MGTGGGEWLAGLCYRPPRTVATESWPPNVGVAKARLNPLGISVTRVEPAPDNVEHASHETRGRLPFPAESFTLVSNRHESFVASEVARVLRTGGTFVTQQVGGDYGDFHATLELPPPDAPDRPWDLRFALEQVEAAGLRAAASGEGVEVTTFADVGALAWYLKAIPWTVDGCAIDSHRARLEQLHERIRATGPISMRLPAFWLEAQKSG